MSDLQSEIEHALSGSEVIPRDMVVHWIRSAQDDLRILSRLYDLTDYGYYRIQPELGSEETCSLIQNYLVECIRQNPQHDDSIETRWEAARTLHAWFCHLDEKGDAAPALARAAQAITDLYLQGDEDLRGAIEQGVLEHALEMEHLRPYFEAWSSDSRLTPAWNRAMEWALDHPNYTWGLLQKIRNISEEK